VFRAPPGFFGTFRHELVHAPMFWDMPLPRWFDEGLAALHENTDRDYRGLPNPWRLIDDFRSLGMDRPPWWGIDVPSRSVLARLLVEVPTELRPKHGETAK